MAVESMADRAAIAFVAIFAVADDIAAKHLQRLVGLRIGDQNPFALELGFDFFDGH